MYIIPSIIFILFISVFVFSHIHLSRANKIIIAEYEKDPEAYCLLVDFFGGYWLVKKQ